MSNYFTINNNSAITPIGSIIAYTGSTSPSGWLICNGSAISRSTYSELFTLLGVVYGSGNGSTTFNLPNYSGAFLRGIGTQTPTIDGGALSYVGPTINTAQAHATQAHTHGANANANANYSASNTDNANGMTALSPNGYDGRTFGIGVSVSVSVSTSTTSGAVRTATNETRPFNYGINWIIKY